MLTRVRGRLRRSARARAAVPDPGDTLLELSDEQLHEELVRARTAVELAQRQRERLDTALAGLRQPGPQELQVRRAQLLDEVAVLERRCAQVRQVCDPLAALLAEAPTRGSGARDDGTQVAAQAAAAPDAAADGRAVRGRAPRDGSSRTELAAAVPGSSPAPAPGPVERRSTPRVPAARRASRPVGAPVVRA